MVPGSIPLWVEDEKETDYWTVWTGWCPTGQLGSAFQ